MIKSIQISGFRGFGISQTVKFAIPDGEKPGSGLTIITGANNSGKTTIIESIRAFIGDESPSFSEGKRNVQTESKVKLVMDTDSGEQYVIETLPQGGSSTQRTGSFDQQVYVVQSRRAMPFEFGKNYTAKGNIKPEHEETAMTLINQINKYFLTMS